MLIAAVIALSGTQNSGVATPTEPAGVEAAPEHCPYARLGVAFYRGRYIHHQLARGAKLPSWRKPFNCADAKYLAVVWAKRAYHARLRTERYLERKAWEHQYAWWLWLPAKFQRVGRCETGGTSGASSAGNWHWDSGTYVSAFGIIRAAFPTWNGHNTPREQYEVAASIQARYGWGAWGCGGA